MIMSKWETKEAHLLVNSLDVSPVLHDYLMNVSTIISKEFATKQSYELVVVIYWAVQGLANLEPSFASQTEAFGSEMKSSLV